MRSCYTRNDCPASHQAIANRKANGKPSCDESRWDKSWRERRATLQADEKASFNHAAVAVSSSSPFASSWQPMLAGIVPGLTQLHSLQSKRRHCEATAVFHRRRGWFLIVNAAPLPGIHPWLCTRVYRRLVLVGWTVLTTMCNLCCPLTPSCAWKAVLEICSFNYCLLVFYYFFFHKLKKNHSLCSYFLYNFFLPVLA